MECSFSMKFLIIKKKKKKNTKADNKHTHIYLFLLAGGSIGGMGIGLLSDDTLGGTTVVERTEAGLPVDVERTEETCSTKFRPN
jgi:hypothetical protein